MRLRQLLPVIVGLSLCIGTTKPVVPRATVIGHYVILVVPLERIDPGDRRPR
jgi:hypothetical protein